MTKQIFFLPCAPGLPDQYHGVYNFPVLSVPQNTMIYIKIIKTPSKLSQTRAKYTYLKQQHFVFHSREVGGTKGMPITCLKLKPG